MKGSVTQQYDDNGHFFSAKLFETKSIQHMKFTNLTLKITCENLYEDIQQNIY